jgi:hypothetical protein
MLESVHGIGALLKQGWRPKRTIVFASWDAEEEGLIGSTEWVEQHAKALEHAVAYFNTDVAVSGPDFSASAVPSLKQFLRELTRSVPSPPADGLSPVEESSGLARATSTAPRMPRRGRRRGSCRRPRLRLRLHALLAALGVPSTDIGSEGPYGVYHSVFDNFAWYTQNADPKFRLSAGDGPRPRPRSPAHGRCRRAALRLRRLRRAISSYIEAAKKSPDEGSTRSTLPPPRLPPLASPSRPKFAQPQIAATGDLAKLNLGPPPNRDRAHLRRPACPIVPGTGTPSTLPASSPATRQS